MTSIPTTTRPIELPEEPCSECKILNDHTWWCRIAPELLPDGTRPYYWRD